MRLVRTILLAALALGAGGCFNIHVPDPPDINIHGEVNNGNGQTDNGQGQADKPTE